MDQGLPVALLGIVVAAFLFSNAAKQPEPVEAASNFGGTTVIRTGETLNLQSAWKARGANMNFVAHGFVWRLNGVIYSRFPDLAAKNLSPGDYSLEFTHSDFLGRDYTYTGQVRVLEPEAYSQLLASVTAANQALFSTDSKPDTVHLPTVLK